MPTRSDHLERRCRRLRRCSSLIALCMLAMSVRVLAADVRVFTDSHHPVEATTGVHVVELDAPARIESDLSAGLPADPAQAATLIRNRLRDGGKALQRRLAKAYQAVVDAWSLGVTELPAVVVDRRYVVYGEPDVLRALARIEAYRRTRG